ncbi:MAG: LCP family protein [Ruminococcus sp.]|nr:LCP family protein [Ruminococcus sp.]
MNIEQIKKKLVNFFEKFVGFLNSHKIISIIVAVVILLAATVFGIANHYLSKLNYSEAGSVPMVYTTAKLKYINLVTGERVDVSNLTADKSGRYTLSDGRMVDDDGSVWNVDGSVVFYDGSYITADGIAVLSDGTTIYADSNVVFQDGTYIANTGIKVDKKNGYATFQNGSKAHISTFIINKDGTIKMKPDDQISSKYKKSKVDEDALIEDALQKAESDPKVKSALADSDKNIARNFNDKKIWYSDNVTNILLMGIDDGSKSYPYGRSDAMILISINKTTKQVKMCSLSRAVYAAIQGYDNTRLSHAHGYGGAALAIDSIERNYKIKIDNYVSTNFKTFQQLIDAIGGVTIKLTNAEAKAMKNKIKAAGLEYKGEGSYKLNGSLALEYVRLRKIDSDRDRTQRQRNVLVAIANRAKNMNVFELNAMLNKILPLITTDLTRTQIFSQVAYLPSYLSGDMKQYVIPHKGTSLTLVDGFEVLLIDWEDEVKYLHDILYEGVTPSYYEK